MKFKLYAAVALGLLAFHQTAFSNTFNTKESLEKHNIPLSLNDKAQQNVPVAKAKPFNLTDLLKDDVKRKENGQPYRFAVPFGELKTLKALGKWESKGTDSIWRVKLSAKEAKSLNIGFKNLFLPKGAKLFIYDDNYQTILGPYTEADNKRHKALWTPVIESSQITVEINVPTKLRNLLSFDFAHINQGYRSIKYSQLNKSGSCNNDVVCSEANEWRDEIRSVARYTINGNSLCTGTLVNNVRQNRRPYFLTADHCGIDSASSQSMVFYWNYETSVCQGSPDGSLNQFQNGASFRASYSDADLALVELDATPDAAFNTHWAGWDNTANAPSSAVAIHHPAGDEKRISFDNDPLTITLYSSDTPSADGDHLRVGQWESGTTESGSSGSGLWNANHHLVGTLHGGSASCDNPDDPDWYGRLHTQWLGGNTSDSQLKHWLDPDDSSAETLDGIDGCTPSTVTITDSPATVYIGQDLEFTANVSSGSGSYTYEWDFNNDGVVDASDSTPSYRYNYFHRGNVKLILTNADNCASVTSVAISVENPSSDVFPQNAQLPTEWSTPTSAVDGWSISNDEFYEGSLSIKANAIADDQSASIEVTETFNEAETLVSFAVKVSSEQAYDFLKFYINDEQRGSWSGDVDWTTVQYLLPQGTHTLRWSYEKDASVFEGDDTAWLDAVTGISMPEAVNFAPVPEVAQSSIEIEEGNTVTLDASNSRDPENDALSFVWEQTSGVDVSLNDADSAIATFEAPAVSSSTTLTFSVTVSDTENNSNVLTVTVVVASNTPNEAPTAAVAQSSISVDEGSRVTLDASASTDPENDTLSFSWTQTSGPNVAISGASSATATFTAPNVSINTQLKFSVTVSDTAGNSDTEEITVTVRNKTVTPPRDNRGGGSGGGAISWLLVLSILLLVRKKL